MKAVMYKDTKTVEVQERAMPVCGPGSQVIMCGFTEPEQEGKKAGVTR